MKVTFIGLGIMGSRMTAHVAGVEGVDLTVYNRTPGKAGALVAAGAKEASSLDLAVAEADVVISMLATPEVVQATAFGERGFVSAMAPNALWMDCSTVAPQDARSFAEQAQGAGIRYLEAPVAGTKGPAEQGALTFFLGGDASDIEQVVTLLDAMGQKNLPMGDPGMAASIKIIVNLQLAQSMAAFSEAVALGIKMGLPEEKLHQVLTNVPVTAPFLQAISGKLLGDDREANFPLQWMHKDLHLVAKTAYEVGQSLPLAHAAKELYAQAKAAGLATDDFSTLYQFVQGKA